MPEIRRNIFGRWEVKYHCPKCKIRLTSSLMEAGDVDTCPECGFQFAVPGSEHREQHEKELARRRREKISSQRLANEERRLALEERKRRLDAKATVKWQQSTNQPRQSNEMRNGFSVVPGTHPSDITQGSSLHPLRDVSDLDSAECPFCAELISARAKKCKHCGEFLDPTLRAAYDAKNANQVNIVNVVNGASATAVAAAKAEPRKNESSCSESAVGYLIITIMIGVIAAITGCHTISLFGHQ